MKRSALLGLLASASLAITFVLQAYVLAVIGPGEETDAFSASLVLPQFYAALLLGPLLNTLVPVLSGKEPSTVALHGWSSLLGTLALTLPFALILGFLAPWWAPLLFPGLGPQALRLAVPLIRIEMVGLLFFALQTVVSCFYQARNRLLVLETTGAGVSVLSLVLLVYALPRYGVTAAAWIHSLRPALITLLLIPALGPPRVYRGSDGILAETWRRLRPLLLGSAYYRTGILVNALLASMAPAGGLSLLNFAERICSGANEVIRRSVVASCVPPLTALAKKGDWAGFRTLRRRRLVAATGLALLGVFLVLVIGKPLMILVLGRGAFLKEEVQQLWLLLVLMGGYLVGGAAGLVLAGSFYVRGDTKTPAWVVAGVYTVGVILKILGFLRFGLLGIAGALSVQYLLVCGVLEFLERRRDRARGPADGGGFHETEVRDRLPAP